MTEDEALDATPQPTDGPDGTSRWYPLRKQLVELLAAAKVQVPPAVVEKLVKVCREFRPS